MKLRNQPYAPKLGARGEKNSMFLANKKLESQLSACNKYTIHKAIHKYMNLSHNACNYVFIWLTLYVHLSWTSRVTHMGVSRKKQKRNYYLSLNSGRMWHHIFFNIYFRDGAWCLGTGKQSKKNQIWLPSNKIMVDTRDLYITTHSLHATIREKKAGRQKYFIEACRPTTFAE
jgi:hypothetical protein